LVSDSSTSTGLAWQPYAAPFVAGKNKIINGDFSVWQRGTSFSANSYCADRWISDTNSTGTISRQTFTPGSAPVAGYEGANFLRFAKAAGGGQMVLFQRIEDVRTLAGQTITLSFWAKADSNVTAGTWMTWRMGSGGAGDFGSGFGPPFNITTTWQRFSATYTMPQLSGVTIGTSSYIEPQFIRVMDSLAHTIDIWGCQLEVGPIATPFTTATGTIQGELAACQRYYWRDVYGYLGSGTASSTTVARMNVPLPVTMRVTPHTLDFSGLGIQDGVNYWVNGTVTLAGNGSRTSGNVLYTHPVGSLTQFRSYFFGWNDANTYLGFSAEL
jgi:hypothetical protein